MDSKLIKLKMKKIYIIRYISLFLLTCAIFTGMGSAVSQHSTNESIKILGYRNFTIFHLATLILVMVSTLLNKLFWKCPVCRKNFNASFYKISQCSHCKSNLE